MHTLISEGNSMALMGLGRARVAFESVWARALLLFGAFCGLKALSAVFLFPPLDGATVWLPGGLMLAVLLRAEKRHWPVYLLTAFLAELSLSPTYGDPWDMAVLWAVGNGLRSVVGAVLMRRWLDTPVGFSRPRDVVALVVAGGLLSPLLSATLGMGTVALFSSGLGVGDFWRGWLNWYLADGLGILLVAPLLLTWGTGQGWLRRPGMAVELAGSMLLLALVAHIAFGLRLPEGILLSLPYLCLPVILWAAMRLGPRGAATATLVLGAFAIGHTAAERGPFGVLPGTLPERVLAVQIFLAVASMSTLLLAVMTEDRRRVERAQRLVAEAGAVLAEPMDPRETLPRVVRLVVPELATGLVVWLADEDGQFASLVKVGVSEEAQGRLLGELSRLSESSRRGLDPEGSFVLARIQHQGRLLGGMALVRAGHTRRFRARAQSFAEDVAHHCALALENARLLGQFQAAIHARDEFIAIAAHELRTPLTALNLQMQGLVRPLRQLPDPEPLLARFQLAARQISRLGRLVEGVLDVGNLNAGRRLQLEREPLDLGELVRDVVDGYSAELERAGCGVSVFVPQRVNGLWDRARLEQALTHLLGNALKFGAGRPIELRVERREDRARLVVTDHGIGVSPEALERIFGRFERAVSSREYGGLGLGLFLAREIVEAHGGTIQVTSQPGEGATFVLELPVSPVTSVHAPSLAPAPPVWAGTPADSHPT
ncbi:MASE1 domain-containing protein [Vitiosangium sp. GDMCC 1.1324]|uniref:sensor histidine kinase n=1 Tax=Vitiosangium sp. (strain GDMCC 1.1324) TaxID=2138576 RepID=UPI00130DD90B|nr:MASE1 domain-containing protein [Vitiosangium sp. GDMCC 1.1324]